MRKKQGNQSPHYGVSNGLTRKGKSVKSVKAEADTNWTVFASIRRAKRFMRTGKEERA